eukprot:jgi/Tetstr1/426555/TSEL_001631.t1
MARYVTWLGNLGTIKASSLQLYLPAVNNFFKDHGREPMALGDLVSRVRKGLAASQVTLNPELMRAPLPARVVLKALTLAKALRLELGPTWGTDPSTVVRVELFRAGLAVVVLCLFFYRGGAGVECRTGDLTVGPDGGILLYHRDRKGQRGVDASKKLLCQVPTSAHADIAALLHYFDAARQGATTAAYVIGVTMQKIKYFGGWAMESSVVLDYIDPIVLPCPAAWHLFGWTTPKGGSGGAAERPDLLELAKSGRVGAKSVSDEDDYLAEEYLWMSCFGAHTAALFVALDELLLYVLAANQDFTPYLARARNHAEAIDKAFCFRLAFPRRLNEVKRVHAPKQPLLLGWRQQLQVADVDEDVAVDAGVAAKVSTSDGVGRLSSELLELCEATFR